MRNRRMRRSISFVSALALLGTIAVPLHGETAQAATKAKLQTKKKVTITEGQTKKIKLKKKAKGAKYTYKSKSKKIATVSKKGVIKGIKEGKTVITVKEKRKGKKKAGTVGKINVTVKAKKGTPTQTPGTSAVPTGTVAPTNPAVPTNSAQPTDSSKPSGTPEPTKPAESTPPTQTPDPSKLELTGDQVKPTTEDDRTTYTLNDDGTVTVPGGWKYYAIAFPEPLNLATVKAIHIKGSTSGDYRLSFGNKDKEYFIDHDNLDSWVYPSAFDGETTIDLTNNNPSGMADWLFLGTKGGEEDVTFNITSISFTLGKPAEGEINTDGITEAKKTASKNNPIAPHRFMADPFAIEYNGTVYVYGTNDSANMRIGQDGKIPENNYSQITSLNCFSSKDMVNWTDEGIIPVSGKKGPASWAKNSWAPAVTYKNIDGKDKFFIYFADNGSGIGVLEGDSPTGPFHDPIGKQLISRDTPNCKGDQVPWLFDPAVFVDDDGQGYIYFGGIGEHKDREHPKCLRVAKLGDDMISLKEDPVEIDAPAPFEDSGINKIGDKYYFSYCTNWDADANKTFGLQSACIAYMTSDSPMGPWSDAKMVLKNPTSYFSGLPSNNNNNNHHCMLMRDGKLYMFYHSQKAAKDMGITQGYRTTGVDEVTIDENGDLTSQMTEKGIAGDKDFNPYEIVEAETFAWANGVSTFAGPEQDNTRNNRVLSSISKDDYVGLDRVAFGEDGAQSMMMRIKSEDDKPKEGTIGIYIDGRDETNKVGEIAVTAGADYEYAKAELTTKVTGTHRLFFVFNVEGIYVDTWLFSKETTPELPKPDSSPIETVEGSVLTLSGDKLKPVEGVGDSEITDNGVKLSKGWSFYALKLDTPVDLSTIKSIHFQGRISDEFRISFRGEDASAWEFFVNEDEKEDVAKQWVSASAVTDAGDVAIAGKGTAHYLLLGTKANPVNFNMKAVDLVQ